MFKKLNQYKGLRKYMSLDNKLIIYVGEDKTKAILFARKHKIKSVGSLNIVHNIISIKHYPFVTYLGCVLDEITYDQLKWH